MREAKLIAEETIMDAVCDVCHWPLAYHDEEAMHTEKCDSCPAEAAVKTALEGLVKFVLAGQAGGDNGREEN